MYLLEHICQRISRGPSTFITWYTVRLPTYCLESHKKKTSYENIFVTTFRGLYVDKHFSYYKGTTEQIQSGSWKVVVWRHSFCDVIRSMTSSVLLRHPSTRPSSWARCSWPWAPGRAVWRRRAASPANNMHSVKKKKLPVNLAKTHCKVTQSISFFV